MGRYEGLDTKLRQSILDRDRGRCRWCGATNRGVDVHHIRYRRGTADDVAENLICLCRQCHSFVHGARTVTGETIAKEEAQDILWELVGSPGQTGLALRRQHKRLHIERTVKTSMEELGPELDAIHSPCDNCGSKAFQVKGKRKQCLECNVWSDVQPESSNPV